MIVLAFLQIILAVFAVEGLHRRYEYQDSTIKLPDRRGMLRTIAYKKAGKVEKLLVPFLFNDDLLCKDLNGWKKFCEDNLFHVCQPKYKITTYCQETCKICVRTKVIAIQREIYSDPNVRTYWLPKTKLSQIVKRNYTFYVEFKLGKSCQSGLWKADDKADKPLIHRKVIYINNECSEDKIRSMMTNGFSTGEGEENDDNQQNGEVEGSFRRYQYHDDQDSAPYFLPIMKEHEGKTMLLVPYFFNEDLQDSRIGKGKVRSIQNELYENSNAPTYWLPQSLRLIEEKKYTLYVEFALGNLGNRCSSGNWKAGSREDDRNRIYLHRVIYINYDCRYETIKNMMWNVAPSRLEFRMALEQAKFNVKNVKVIERPM